MKKNSLIYLLVFFLVSACAVQTTPMYYWGDYSTTLYHYKKNLTDEKLIEHKNSLLIIIKKSNELGIRVPPGIYGELGFIYFNEGNLIEAKKFINLEAKTYPESQYFMNKILVKINENK